MRTPALIISAVLLEAGWLALWPLSVQLSHSALFTAAVLDEHPLLGVLLRALARLTFQPLSPTLTDAPGAATYLQPAATLALLMLVLSGVYVLALILLDRGPGALRLAPTIIVASALVFQATLLLMPGIFSQDVFGYIAYGRLAADYGLNPYVWPPSVLRDPIVPWVADVWRTYATPYGPLWVNLQWLLARASGDLSIADQALVYRGLASGLLLADLVLAWRVLGRLTPLNATQRTTALAALAWNPVLLFEVAGNAHNDALMLTFSLASLLLLSQSSRGLLAGAALTLGVLVKYLSGIGLLWLALASMARVSTWSRRVRGLAVLGIVCVGLVVLMAAPWLELPDSLDPLLNETAHVGYVNSLPDTMLLMLVDHLGGPLEFMRGLERLLVLGLFGAYLVWETRKVWTDPTPGSVARGLARSSLLYVLLVSTSVQTWYFCLPLTIACVLGWRRRIARLSLAYSALALPALYLSYYMREATPGWVFLAYGLLPLLVLAPDVLATWTRSRPHVPPALVVGHDEQRARSHAVAGTVMEQAGR